MRSYRRLSRPQLRGRRPVDRLAAPVIAASPRTGRCAPAAASSLPCRWGFEVRSSQVRTGVAVFARSQEQCRLHFKLRTQGRYGRRIRSLTILCPCQAVRCGEPPPAPLRGACRRACKPLDGSLGPTPTDRLRASLDTAHACTRGFEAAAVPDPAPRA